MGRFIRLTLTTIMLVLLALPASIPTSAASNSGRKILIDADADTARQQASATGTLLADYGGFSLWRVPDTIAQRLSGQTGVNYDPTFDTISLRNGAIDPLNGIQRATSPKLTQVRTDAAQFWMVQFIGPLKDAWMADVERTGVRPVISMPNNAFVVWGDGEALAKLDKLAAQGNIVQWAGPYHPDYRLAPALHNLINSPNAAATTAVTVQFYAPSGDEATLKALLAKSRDVYEAPFNTLDFTNVSLELPTDLLVALANTASVFNIEPWVAPERLDERQSQILAGNITTVGGKTVPTGPGYLQWLSTTGLPTNPSEYPIIDVVDDGIDQGNAAAILHPDFYVSGLITNTDRVEYIANCTADASGNGLDGHGNINAGIVAGYNNRSGAPYTDTASDGVPAGSHVGLGVSPYGRVAGTKVFRNNNGPFDSSACPGSYNGVVQRSYDQGADITTNSWGANVGGAYAVSSQAYDALTRDASGTTAGLQPMLHIFAAGNAGPGSTTIGAPGSGKNVLTVGATENVRDNGVADGCNYTGGDNADDIATFSSRGPTSDQRTKPDIMAPGTHVMGPASQQAGFNGIGVCGNSSSDNRYYPNNGQTLYTWSSGTSHSTPAVAGGASLLHTKYRLTQGVEPSPAMLKAYMINSRRYLGAIGGNLPNNNQGYGDLLLAPALDNVAKVFIDQTTTFNTSGESFTYVGNASSPTHPVMITVAWTDAPGSTTGNAYVNNLDLTVVAGGQTYRGNVFTNGLSTPGGSADARNNVEQVMLPAGVTGPVIVQVRATNIAGDAIPGVGDATDQDFALAMYNISQGQNGTIAGTVRGSNNAPLAGARVMTDLGIETLTNAMGQYTLSSPVGTYTMTASLTGYGGQVVPNVVVTAGVTTTQDFVLQAGYLAGTVTNATSSEPLPGVRVLATGTQPYTTTTASDGTYFLPLTPGTYSVNFSKIGYQAVTVNNVSVTNAMTTTQNAALTANLHVAPSSLSKTLTFGQVVTDTPGLTFTNNSTSAYTVSLTEGDESYMPIVAQATGNILLVNTAATQATAAQAALTSLGYTVESVTSTTFEGRSVANLLTYSAVVYVGNTTTASNNKLMAYLDAGGRLFITDNDLGFWQGNTTFYTTYLDADYVDDAPPTPFTLSGVDILAGLNIPSSDPYPDYFTTGSSSTPIAQYVSNSSTGGSRIERNNYRAVYIATDFDRFGTTATGELIERQITEKVMEWLLDSGAGEGLPWIDETPQEFSLAAGATSSSEIRWDASQVPQPGIYTTTVKVKYTLVPTLTTSIPVSFTVLPAANQGELQGVVSATGVCDTAAAPLANATVKIDGTGGFSVTLTTDSMGAYHQYLTNGTYTVTISRPGYSTSTQTVTVTAGNTTTHNVTLRLLEACMALSPSNFSVAVAPGETVTRTLMISSTGAMPLAYTLVEATHPVTVAAQADGQMYLSSADYAWIDASDGTAYNLTEEAEQTITLPFSLTLYGKTSNLIRIGNNGAILFGASSGELNFSNPNLLTPTSPDMVIAPFWDDLSSQTGNIYVKTIGSAPNRQVIVEWLNRPRYDNIGNATFEVVFNENGSILFQYQDVMFGNASFDKGAGATVGIRGMGVNQVLQHSFNTASLEDLTALCFSNAGAPSCSNTDIPWLEVNPESGSLTGTPPSSQAIDVTLNSNAMTTEGVYRANLVVLHSATQPLTVIPITLTVGNALSGLNVTSNSPVALGSTSLFTTTLQSGTATGYTWNFGDGTVRAGAANESHVYAQAGSYTVMVTATNSTNSVSANTTMVVNTVTAPLAGLNVTSNTPVELGSTSLFTTTLQSGVAITYTWNFGDGTVRTGTANESHVYAQAGSYTVTVTAANSVNSISSNTTMVVTEEQEEMYWLYLPYARK